MTRGFDLKCLNVLAFFLLRSDIFLLTLATSVIHCVLPDLHAQSGEVRMRLRFVHGRFCIIIDNVEQEKKI